MSVTRNNAPVALESQQIMMIKACLISGKIELLN